jgi:hypothetical protein
VNTAAEFLQVPASIAACLVSGKARGLEMVAEECPEKHEQGGNENRGYGATR